MPPLLCKDCKYFSQRGSICQKYRFQDVVHGGVKNYNAYYVRQNEKMCAPQGRDFERAPKGASSLERESQVSSPIIVCSAEGCVVVYGNNIFTGPPQYSGADEEDIL